jgi:tRNA A-37 threonylcarbamoyl transferase component Bud32
MLGRYGRYEVLYKLGQGAMAQVFLARDPLLSRFVAVKVLHAELASRKDVLQRFFNEARTVAVVRNPHIVEVFDFGQEGNDLYLVMEFVEGLSLHNMILRMRRGQDVPARQDWSQGNSRVTPLHSEPIDSAVAAALMCQAAEGLSAAARHGVVHRDVKPENLMIDTQGYLKISDFGIAHVQDDSITKTGAVLGSPLYMSPEQAQGRKPITSQADMFSLGAVFYSCLAGHPPFRGKSLADLFRKIATEAHTPLRHIRPDLDPALGNLIETLLQKDPADRGGGPRWLHRQLKGYLMALGAMDPAELVAGYLQELSAKGIQTTWTLDAADPGRAATLPAGAASAATERYTRESVRQRPGMGSFVALGILGAAAGGAMWGSLHYSKAIRAPGPVAAEAVQTGGGGSPAGLAPSDVHSGNAVTNAASDAGPGDGIATGTMRPMPGPEVRQDRAEGPEEHRTANGAEDADAVLIIKSSPPFAEAFVDGRYVGVTPVRINLLESGRHRVRLKAKGAQAIDTVIALRPGSQGYKFMMDGAGEAARLAVIPEEGP